MRYLILLATLLSVYGSHAQNISTYAGTGVYGFLVDGGPATGARFRRTAAMGMDNAGNMYIADRVNHRIRRINSSGVISTIAGTGTAGFTGDGGLATSARLNNPVDVAYDATYNFLYISDQSNRRIRRLNLTTGIISTIVGTGIAGYNGHGILATTARINNQWGGAVDAAGNVYIGDVGNHRIRKITLSTGLISTIAGTGTSGFSGDGGLATSAQISSASGVDVDAAGNVYIADFSNNRIRKITASTGMISTIAGTGTAGFSGDGGLATAAMLNGPINVFVDGIGRLYIADENNHRIRMIDLSNNISSYAGTGTAGYSGDGGLATSANINLPTDIYLDASYNGYIADYNNNRIRMVSTACNFPTTPTITASATSVCLGDSVLLVVSAGSLNDATGWNWHNGSCSGTTLAINDSLWVSPSTTSTYFVNGLGGCVVSSTCQSVTITVNSATVTTGTTDTVIVCDGDTLTFSGTGASTYSWTGGITNGTAFVPVLGTTTYIVTGTTVSGCVDSDTVVVVVNGLPTVVAGADATAVCLGTQVTFTGSGANSYVWSFGIVNGSPSSTFPGAVDYVVEGTDLNGCKNADTITVTTYSFPLITGNANATSLCNGDSLVLYGTGGVSYSWNLGVTDSVGFVPSVGSYVYVVTGTDAFGCTGVATVSVTVHDFPTVMANAADSTLCDGDTLILYGTGAATYNWTGGITDSSGVVVTTGTSTYVVTGTDMFGCVNTDSIDIVVTALPNIIAMADDSALCVGDSVTLTGAGGISYTWNNGAVDGMALLPASDTTVFTVTGTDVNGCVNTDSIKVTVHTYPVVTANVSDTLICLGDSVVFSGSGALTYTWDNGVTDGIITTTLEGLLVYTVIGDDGNGCTDTAQVTVNTLSGPKLSISGTNPTCAGSCNGMAVVEIISGVGPFGYDWDDAYDQKTDTAMILCSGTYTVTVIDSANGCATNESINLVEPLPITITSLVTNETLGSDGAIDITVTGGTSPYTYDWSNSATSEDITGLTPAIYTVVVTDSMGCVDSADITVGTTLAVNGALNDNQFSVYPNPFNDVVYLQWAGAEATYELRDAAGKLISSAALQKSQSINTAKLERGTYFIKVISEKGVEQIKLVKN